MGGDKVPTFLDRQVEWFEMWEKTLPKTRPRRFTILYRRHRAGALADVMKVMVGFFIIWWSVGSLTLLLS